MGVEPNTSGIRVDQIRNGIDTLFCQCGSLLRPQKQGNKICPKGCQSQNNKVSSEEMTMVISQIQRPKLEVYDTTENKSDTVEENGQQVYKRTKWCDKCDAERAVRAQIEQTRSADEPPTRLYTCKVCRKSWREG